MRPEFFEDFCREFTTKINRLRIEERGASTSAAKRDLERVKRHIQQLIEALKAGVIAVELKTEMDILQARKEALLAQLRVADEQPPLLHPSMADLYRVKVEQLAIALRSGDELERAAASDAVRGCVDAIVLTPEDGNSASRFAATWQRCWTRPKKRKGRQKATSPCRYRWLRGPATVNTD